MGKKSIRRVGTRPLRTYWTPDAVALIDAYREAHNIASFSAAAETLIRMGLDQSPGEIVTPIVASAVRQAIHSHLERLIRLQITTAIDAGMAYRFAAATARDVVRLHHDDDTRYQEMKRWVTSAARKAVYAGNTRSTLEHLYEQMGYGDLAPPKPDTLGILYDPDDPNPNDVSA